MEYAMLVVLLLVYLGAAVINVIAAMDAVSPMSRITHAIAALLMGYCITQVLPFVLKFPGNPGK